MDDNAFFENLQRQKLYDSRKWNCQMRKEREENFVANSAKYSGVSLVSAGKCECGTHYKVYVKGSQQASDAVCPRVFYMHKLREAVRAKTNKNFLAKFPYEKFIAKFKVV